MFDIRNITEDEAKKQLEYLAKEIEKADIAYYQNDAPYLDDAAYDKLRRLNDALEAKFPALIRNDSPSKRVGAMVKSEFKKVELSVPMLSLADIFSEEELKDFIMSIKRFLNSSDDIIFTSEPKMDGLSFSALYVNGIFTRGSTRGDGKIGEDITENLKAIRGFPLFLNKEAPEVFEVRGEVFMSKADFLALNQKTKKNIKKRLRIREMPLPVHCASWIRALRKNGGSAFWSILGVRFPKFVGKARLNFLNTSKSSAFRLILTIKYAVMSRNFWTVLKRLWRIGPICHTILTALFTKSMIWSCKNASAF